MTQEVVHLPFNLTCVIGSDTSLAVLPHCSIHHLGQHTPVDALIGNALASQAEH